MLLAVVINEWSVADRKARLSERRCRHRRRSARPVGVGSRHAHADLVGRDAADVRVPPDVPVSAETFQRLIHPDDRPVIAAAMEDGVHGRSIDVQFRVVFPDGRVRWIHSRGRTVCDELGQPMRLVGVKVDITERKAAEQRLQEQQRKLAHSARVSVAGELSSALSHELNQPLAAILANAAAARRFLLHDPRTCGRSATSSKRLPMTTAAPPRSSPASGRC